MPKTINDFPVEVLQEIIKTIFYSGAAGDASFLECLRTCSLWRQICEPFLYGAISLTGLQLVRFCTRLHDAARMTKSLTINIRPTHYGAQCPLSMNFDPAESATTEETRLLWAGMEQLCKVFPMMDHLQSFSFRVAHEGSEIRVAGFYLRRRELCDILRSLPQSVRHLELDTLCYDYNLKGNLAHLCPTLRALMPQLDNIRLRLAQLCLELLPDISGTSDARSFVPKDRKRGTFIINTVGQETESVTTPCTQPQRQLWANSYDNRDAIEADHWDCTRFLSHLCMHAVAVNHRGLLGNFGQCFVYDIQRPRIQLLPHRYCSAINERDLFPTKRLSKYPIAPDPPSNPQQRVHLCYKSRNGMIEDWFGKLHDLLDYAEGGEWVETIRSHRFPTSYTTPPCLRPWELKTIPVVDFWDLIMFHPHSCPSSAFRLWNIEPDHDRQILNVQESDNIDDVGVTRLSED